MHAPQIIFVCLVVYGLAVEIERHGKPKTGNNNAWVVVIAIVIQMSLLYWGGFFGRGN